MNVYISGGSKCGKSEFAENMARRIAEDKKLPLYYVATMIPKDDEDLDRVKKHKDNRKNKGFETLELKVPEDFYGIFGHENQDLEQGFKKKMGGKPGLPKDWINPLDEDGVGLSGTAAIGSPGVFLVDSVTALLENTIFDEKFNVDENAWKIVTELMERLMKFSGNVVFVSDFVYSDGIIYDEVTETYRKNLAMCDRRIAEKCDCVYEVTYGCPIQWK